MGTRDPRVDAYVAKSAPFAQPILQHLRETIHSASPRIEETMKWSFPHFMHHGIVCSMAAFKEHCAFGFWKQDLVLGGSSTAGRQAMGQFGRIRSLLDLPSRKVLVGYVRRAMRLNEQGVKPVRKPVAKRAALRMPADLRAALAEQPAAAANFERLRPSQRREYVEWIVEAKREDTRARRIATAVEWIADGKPRHWKYRPARAGTAALIPATAPAVARGRPP